MLALSVGLYLGWRFVEISPTLFASPLPGVAQTSEAMSYPLLAGELAVLVCLAFALPRLRKRVGGCRDVRGLAAFLVLALLMSAGTALSYLCGWVGRDGQALTGGVIAGQALMAVDVVVVVVLGAVLSRLNLRQTLACVSAGYTVAFGIDLLVACLSPVAAMVFRSLLPLLSGLAFTLTMLEPGMGSGALPSSGADAPAPPEATPSRRTGLSVLRVLVGTGIFGAIFTLANHLSETKTTVSTEMYTLVAGVAVGAFVLACACATRRATESGFTRFYRLITPLIVCCLLLTLVLQSGYQRYEALMIGLTWVLFRIITWTMWAQLGSRTGIGGSSAFAAGQAMLMAFSTLAELVCAHIDLSAVPITWSVAAIILLAMVNSGLVLGGGEAPERLVAQTGADSAGEPGGQTDLPATGTGDSQVDEALLAKVTAPFGLSEREVQIALLAMRGNENAAIAQIACITESTLRTHLRNIYGKMEVHSRQELVERLEELAGGKAGQA